MPRGGLLLVVLVGCGLPNYQWSPYVEVQRREEEFTGRGTIQDDYTGYTLMVGARLVPDTRVHLESLLHLRAVPAPAPTTIVVPTTTSEDDGLPDADIGWIARYGTYGGAACILALTALVFVIRRRRQGNGAD